MLDRTAAVRSATVGDVLAPKHQMARHRWRAVERGDVQRTTLIAILGTAFWCAIFVLALKLLRYFRSTETIGDLLAGKLLSMMLLSLGSILLLSNIIASLSNFFLSRDLDQFAAAPVRPRVLYLARLAETTLHSSWMVGLLLVPIVTAYGVAYHANVLFLPFMLAVTAPFFVIPAAAGSAITLLLVNVFPARRTRDLLSVITALSVAGLLLLFRAARPEQLARPEGFQNFMQFVASLDAPSSPILPSEWVSGAMMGWLQHTSVWLPLLELWSMALLLVTLGGAAHARGWARGFSQAQDGANRRGASNMPRSWFDRALLLFGPTRRELVLKELRVFARDSTQWSQLVMLAVLVVVYVANVRYLPLSGQGITALLRNVIPFLNLALAGFVLASIAARFVFPSVSLEGRALWLLQSSPLAMRDLLWAKFWVGALPLLFLALILVGVTNTMLGVRPFVQLVSLSAITALVFPLTALALSYGTFYPRFDSENAAQIPTSFGGLLFMMTAIVLIGAIAFLTGKPAAHFVVAEHFGWARDPLTLILPFVAAAVVCVVGTALPLVLARRRLESLERA